MTNPSISSYRFGNGSVTSFSNNNSRRGSLGSGLAPDDGRLGGGAGVGGGAQESASIASQDGALEAGAVGGADDNVSISHISGRIIGGGGGASTCPSRPLHQGPSRFLEVSPSTNLVASTSSVDNSASLTQTDSAGVGTQGFWGRRHSLFTCFTLIFKIWEISNMSEHEIRCSCWMDD